ncbi:hypothetical protein TrVGV298_000612 [Trichoderma virens]|nr:hypothetical protein TrVGV298_000612 [Trichoderma virens]
MATPLESSIGAAVQILQVIIDLSSRIKSAADKRALSLLISQSQNEVTSLKDIVMTIGEEESLQTKTIIEEIAIIQELAISLEDLLKTMESAGFLGRFRHGDDHRDELRTLTAEISRVKSNLMMKIQSAHVGLTVSSNQRFIVQMDKIEQVDANLKRLISGFEGLMIRDYLHGREQSSDGTILLDESDLVDLGLKTKEDGPYQDGSRLIDNNIAIGQAIMINGTIGIEGFVEPKHVKITNNVAQNQATMVNASISEKTWDQVREERVKMINLLADKGLLTGENITKALQRDPEQNVTDRLTLVSEKVRGADATKAET